MPDVLEFNPNRDLEFDPKRDLGFDPGRKLGFDPKRARGFEPGRDLGFGKRGPVFRGYVCPICGAQGTADQPSSTGASAPAHPRLSDAAKARGVQVLHLLRRALDIGRHVLLAVRKPSRRGMISWPSRSHSWA